MDQSNPPPDVEFDLPVYFSPVAPRPAEPEQAEPPDPDDGHPHAKLLKSIVALATALSAECNKADADANIRRYLLDIGFMVPRAKIVKGRKYGWQCVGLRGLYRVVKLAGLDSRTRNKAQVLKQFQDAMNPDKD